MTKEQAKNGLEKLEKEKVELQEIINKPSPEDFLKDIISRMRGKVSKDSIIWCIDGHAYFKQIIKYKYLLVSFSKVWEVFESNYGMSDDDIQIIIKDVVGQALNCKDFIPKNSRTCKSRSVGQALNCKDFIPEKNRQMTKTDIEKSLRHMEQDIKFCLRDLGYGYGYRKWKISKETCIPEDILTVLLKRLKYRGEVELIMIFNEKTGMPDGSGYCLAQKQTKWMNVSHVRAIN